MNISEFEKNLINYFIQIERIDIANLFYLSKEKYTWGLFKELISIASRDYLRLEEKYIIEVNKILQKIENDFSLGGDEYITKFIYDYCFTSVEKIIESAIHEGYIPVRQHVALFGMLFNMPKLSRSFDSFISKNTIQVLTRYGNIQLKYKANVLQRMIKKYNNSQIQLLCYCIYLYQVQDKNHITFNIKDYCKLRGIGRQYKNIKKIIDDFYMLEHIYFTFNTNVKGQKRVAEDSKVLKIININTRQNEIEFIFGEWIYTLSTKQYSLFSKNFFQYKTGKNANSHLIIISLKLNEIIRNNLNKKKGKNSINVGKLIDLLYFNQDTINAKGFVIACQESIEQALDEIAKEEGYLWNFRKGEYKSFSDFKKDYIEFENPRMHEAYRKTKIEKFIAY